MEPYEYYARSNQSINKNMFTIIKNNPLAYDYVVDGYYKSIGEILDHIYVSDVHWIKDFGTVKSFTIHENELFKNLPEYGKRLSKNIDEYVDKRTILDALILKMCSEINTDDLEKHVIKIRRNGERVEKTFWKALIHFFNHQTHHRGQISEILDTMKIENDYSNMVFIE